MIQPEIEPRSPESLANTLSTRLIYNLNYLIVHDSGFIFNTNIQNGLIGIEVYKWIQHETSISITGLNIKKAVIDYQMKKTLTTIDEQ